MSAYSTRGRLGQHPGLIAKARHVDPLRHVQRIRKRAQHVGKVIRRLACVRDVMVPGIVAICALKIYPADQENVVAHCNKGDGSPCGRSAGERAEVGPRIGAVPKVQLVESLEAGRVHIRSAGSNCSHGAFCKIQTHVIHAHGCAEHVVTRKLLGDQKDEIHQVLHHAYV
jgi:hypothetical protein